MIHILLVDDQNLIQEGIKALLEQHVTEFEVVGTVKDGHNAIKLVEILQPDIVLLDIEMPEMDGITVTKHISSIAPETKVIILTSHEDREYIMQSLLAGAKGYLLKSSLMKDLKQAILAVNSGYCQLESRLLAKIFNSDSENIQNSKLSTLKSLENKQDEINFVEDFLQKEQEISLEKERVNSSDEDSKQSLFNYQDISTELESNELVVSSNLPSNSSLIDSVRVTSETKPLKTETSNTVLTSSQDRLTETSDSSTLSQDRQANIHSKVPLLPVVNQIAISMASECDSSSQDIAKKHQKNYFRQLVNRKNISRLIFRSRLVLRQYQKKILQYNNLKSSQSNQKSNKYKIKLTQSKSKLLFLVKNWHQKKIFSNIGLIILGAVIFYLIHSFFEG